MTLPSRVPASRVRRLVVLAVIAAVALSLRLVGLEKGLWLDEYYSRQACCATEGKAWLLSMASQMLPYHVMLALWGFVNDGEASLRLLSVALGLTAIIVTMASLARRSLPAAVLAGALLGCLPVLLRYSHEIRGYGLVIALTAVAVALAATPGSLVNPRVMAALSVTMAVAAVTHPTAILLAPAIVMYAGVRRLPGAADPWTWAHLLWLPAAAAAVAVAGAAWLQAGALSQWWMPPPSWTVMAGVGRVMLGVDRVAWPPPSPGARVAAIALLIAVMLAARSAPTEPPGSNASAMRRDGIALLAAAGVYLAGLLVCSLLFPAFWPRTTLPMLVPAASGLALVICASRLAAVRLGGSLLVVLLCAAWAGAWLAGGASRAVEPWREAGRWVDARWQPGDAFVVYPKYGAGLAHLYAPHVAGDAVAGLEAAEDAAGIDRTLDAGAGAGGVTFVLARADFTTGASYATFEQLLSSLARRRASGQRVRLLVLTSSDAEVDAQPADTAMRMQRDAAVQLGAPASVSSLAPGLVVMEFD